MKLEQVWLLYRSSLKAFLHSRLSNHSDVDDLLQEILLKTHQSLDSLKNESSIKVWLFQIANRSVIDFYRKKASLFEKEIEEHWYGVPDKDIRAELSQCVEPFINTLENDTADLLREIDLNGKSQREYAADSGVSYSTLKSRVKKARKELRKLFESCCYYQLDQQGNLMNYSNKTIGCIAC